MFTLLLSTGCGGGPSGALTAPIAPIETVDVVQVVAPIPLGAPLGADVLEVASFPSSVVPGDAVDRLDGALGRRARRPLVPGELVRASLLDDPREAGPTTEIPLGWRAIPVAPDDALPVPDGGTVDLWRDPGTGPCLAVQGATHLGNGLLALPEAQVPAALEALADPTLRRTLRHPADTALNRELACP